MANNKIKRNLSDEEMLKGYKEDLTFETIWDDTPTPKQPIRKEKKEADKEGIGSFFTPELQEQVGKALLELKVELYKQGIVDYKIKVVRENNQVMLQAVPAGEKKNTDKKASAAKKR